MNKSDWNSNEENNREDSDCDNNDMNDSDSEDEKEVEEKNNNNKLKRNSSYRVKCDKKSKTKEVVSKYKEPQFIGDGKVACTFPDCGAVVLYCNLKYHLDLHSDERFKCNYKGCNEVFKTRERLRRHRYQHLGKYKCQFDTCNFIGDSFSKLEKHKITHSDERPVKCKHCDKRFKNKYGLNGHMKTLHPEECRDLPLLVCEVDGCQYQTKSTGGFNGHKRKHNLPFECDICHKKFANKTIYKDHRYRHSDEKPFKCKHCSKGFPTERNLRRHTERLHKPQTIPCDVKGCGKYFYNSYTLDSHKKTHQDKSTKEKFHCEWPDCDKKFTVKGHLEIHMNRHNGNYPFHCQWPECEKYFATKQQLKGHCNTHTGNKPFSCQWPDCDKSFSSSNALGVHIKRHQGYTYSCRFDDCDFKCYNSVRLKQHYRNHHDNFVE